MSKTGSCFRTFFIITVLSVLLPYFVFEWLKYRYRSDLVSNFKQSDVYEFENDPNEGLLVPHCPYPYVIRNALDFGDFEEDCKTDNENNNNGRCGNFIRDRLIKQFGDRIVLALPPTHKTEGVFDFYAGMEKVKKSMNVTEYFENPEYERYALNFLQYLGNEDEYLEFFNFTRNKNITNQCSGNDIYCVIEKNPHWQYLGSQFFITHFLNSGSFMHFAMGMNIFFQLAGRKRWLLINPAYMVEGDCTVEGDGMIGSCLPNGYQPIVDNISIAEYKDILLNHNKLPSQALIDLTLEPGDILINCPVWAHAIQNLDELSVGFAIRATLTDKPFHNIYWTNYFLKGIARSLETKFIYGDWEKVTIVDYLWKSIFGKKNEIDESTKTSKETIKNTKIKNKDRIKANKIDYNDGTEASEAMEFSQSL